MMSVWTRFRSAVRAFSVAHAGNVAITFALASLPIVATVGYAVDYSRANSVKVAVQSALDATALMISKEAPTDTPAQMQTNAQKYFLALFNRPDVTNVTVNASYSNTNGTQVVISSYVDVPTTFLAAFGWNTMTVGNSSTVMWGSSRLRVALVLDNTGSMADSGKITALKTATNNLLTQLNNAATTNGDVYVSIVPFVKDVNIDPSNWNSDYIYWGTAAQDPTLSDNNSWDANNGTCSTGNYSPEAVYGRRHLLDFRQDQPKQLYGRRHLLDFRQDQPKQLHSRRRVLEWRRNDPEQLHRHESLLEVAVHITKLVHIA